VSKLKSAVECSYKIWRPKKWQTLTEEGSCAVRGKHYANSSPKGKWFCQLKFDKEHARLTPQFSNFMNFLIEISGNCPKFPVAWREL
jgi:hypothetical protein